MAAPAAGGSTAALPPKPTTWAGQVAVITGGAQGIGFGVAEHLGGLGVAVCLVDMNEAKNAEAVAALTARGIKATSAVVNVADAAQWAAALEGFVAAHGRVDILVQAAGVTGKTGIKTHEVDPANFDFVLNVNARGIFLGCRAVLPYMVARGYGRIVNIASVAGKDGNAGMVAYSASKGAVIAMTKAIGKEYAETGVTCNALAPAVVRTAMVDAMPESQVAYMTDKIPMKRCGTIQEIASLVAFIASPECSFTTAFTFDATGGRRVQRRRGRAARHAQRAAPTPPPPPPSLLTPPSLPTLTQSSSPHPLTTGPRTKRPAILI